MSASTWLAVDAGGSGARAMWGERRWERRGPASAGAPLETSALWGLLDEVAATVPADTPVVLGAAGASREEARRGLERELRARGWRGPLVIGPDYLAPLWAPGTGPRVVALLLGTGSVLASRQGKVVRRAGGWGALVGDLGSGTELGGWAAARLASAFDDGEEPPDALAHGLADLEGASDAAALRARVAGPGGVAALAPAFLRWAAEDPEPAAALEGACAGLARAAARLVDDPDTRVLVGGGLAGSELYMERLGKALASAGLPAPERVSRETLLAGLAALASSEVELLELTRRPGVEALSPTELSNPFTTDLDALEPEALVDRMLAEAARTVRACAAVRAPLAAAVAQAAVILREGGRLFYVGAGTSGRLGVLDASESPPTFHVEPDRIQGVIAGGERAAFESIEGAEDDPAAGAAALEERGLAAGDMVVGVAASGGTPFVRGALRAARERGAATALVTSHPRAEARGEVDFFLGVPTGPEVLRGSTRLGAGTAAKVLLNILSTGAWVACGKAYGNYMVDLRRSNEKLERRARRILGELAGVGEDEAGALLEAAGGRVKTALLMQARGIEREDAEAALAEVGGRLRELIGEPGER